MYMMKMEEMDIPQVIKDAAVQHAREGIPWLREELATPVDGPHQPAAPWF
jgi:hypothetical protein